MNRTFLIIFLVVAVALAIYNITLLDFTNLFQGDSFYACIGVMASFCAILLLLIYWTSKRVQEKLRNKNQ